jgi:hypothetical protein
MKKGIKVFITLMAFSMLISSSWARKEQFRCEQIFKDNTIPLDSGCSPGSSVTGGPCGTEQWVLFLQSGKGRNKRWNQQGIHASEEACEGIAKGN